MIRIGHGYDSHRFGEGLELTLGGVKIPHCRGLSGHSDADAVLHALTDAILGAIAAGDIGQHFSDKDPKWKGAASQKFVEYAVSHAAEKGFVVVNCDITIITETPKIAPHKDSMRQNIANMLGVAAERVSVKGKTNEGMGFVGRGEGLVAEAVVLLANATIAGMIGK